MSDYPPPQGKVISVIDDNVIVMAGEWWDHERMPDYHWVRIDISGKTLLLGPNNAVKLGTVLIESGKAAKEFNVQAGTYDP